MNRKNIISIIIIVLALGLVYFVLSKDNVNQLSKTNTENLARVNATQTIELKDGDTFNLTASIVKNNIAGKEVKMLAYNGSIPGPVIKVAKNSEIIINFTNNIDIPSTIHSHGIRLENKFDGVPNLTQKEVGIGKSFTYKIKFDDEGIFWYHPHLREDYAQELGLYGNYIVTSDDQNYFSPVNGEMPLTIDDILMTENGIARFTPIPDHTLMGRFGNLFLVNGSENFSLEVLSGEVVRFYITNTANTRVFNLSIPRAKIKLVGGDNGKYEKETFVESVLLGPSERAIIEVLFDKSGKYTLEHITPNRTYKIGEFNVSTKIIEKSFKSQFLTLRTNTDTKKSIDPYREYFDTRVDKNITLSVEMKGMMQGGMHMMPDGTMMTNSGMMIGENDSEKIEWEDNMAMMNSMSNIDTVKWKIIDTDTKKENEKIDWKFKVGDKVKIKIFNDPKSVHPMQHPIHFHGQRFLILTTNGIKNENLVWKDTTLIQKGDTVEILLDISNPGVWMAHCHIPEHMESGMMFNFEVQ